MNARHLLLAGLLFAGGRADALAPTAACVQPNTAMVCSPEATAVPLLRSQGVAELTGDIVITCTGGIPTASNQPIPLVNLEVYFSSDVTSRLFTPSPFGEPLLLLDEPCTPGELGGPLGSTCPANATPPALCTAADGICPLGNTNLFRGRIVENNAVAFWGVPINPPGPGGAVTLRITNIRVDANSAGPTTGPAQMLAAIAASPSELFVVTNPELTVGYVLSGLSVTPGTPVSIPAGGGQLQDYVAVLQEGFATAFKPRGWLNPQGVVEQDIPGAPYYSESGFVTPLLSGDPTLGESAPGEADFGTRFQAVFTNIPPGASLSVDCMLTAPASSGSTATANLVSPASSITPCAPGVQVPLTVSPAGQATATWEIATQSPFMIDGLNLPVHMNYPPCNTTIPEVQLCFAPTASQAQTQASATAPLPRFVCGSGQLAMTDAPPPLTGAACQSPIAVAGNNQTLCVPPGTTVTLDGSQSTDPNTPPYSPLTYQWVQVPGTGPAVALSGANTVNPTFPAPDQSQGPVDLQFALTVTDSVGLTGEALVDVQVNCPAPVTITLLEPDGACVDGSNATISVSTVDTNGQPPESLCATLDGQPQPPVCFCGPSSATGAPCSNEFTATGPLPLPVNTAVFQATSIHGDVTQATFTVDACQPPTASAGNSQTICASTPNVAGTLNGLGTNPNSPPLSLSYAWVETDSSGAATLLTPNNASTAFTAPAPSSASEQLTFQLTVTNSDQLAAVANTSVTLWPPTAPPVIVLEGGSGAIGAAPGSLSPLANAGTLSVLSNQMVTLDASQSTDAQGNRINYTWTPSYPSSSPPINLSGLQSAQLSFQTPAIADDTAGPLIYQFLVTATPVVPSGDTCAATSSTALVTVKIDENPVAVAKVKHTTQCGGSNDLGAVCGGELVTLDGSASFDPNGSGITTYTWMQLSNSVSTATGNIQQPEVTLTPASDETVSFIAPTLLEATTYTFALVVTDGLGLSSINTNNVVSVSVKAENEMPIADASSTLPTIAQGATATLLSTGSYDPDGDPITYLWKQIGGPSVCLSDTNQTCSRGCSNVSTQANPTFVAPHLAQCGGAKSQVLTFELIVTDAPTSAQCGGPLSSTPVVVTITDVEPPQPPVADAGRTQTVNDGSPVQLDGSASTDPNNEALIYVWSQIQGPAASLSVTNPVKPTFIAPQVPDGTTQELVFKLTVTDTSNLTSSATVAVYDKGIVAPPNCAGAYPSVAQLWPPSHEMINVSILGVKDPTDPNVQIAITSIEQDEPTSGTCPGDTPIDGVINNDGSCLLRAERGTATGHRTYYVNFKATDQYGNCCNGQVTVGVPPTSGGSCSPRGANYNSCQ